MTPQKITSSSGGENNGNNNITVLNCEAIDASVAVDPGELSGRIADLSPAGLRHDDPRVVLAVAFLRWAPGQRLGARAGIALVEGFDSPHAGSHREPARLSPQAEGASTEPAQASLGAAGVPLTQLMCECSGNCGHHVCIINKNNKGRGGQTALRICSRPRGADSKFCDGRCRCEAEGCSRPRRAGGRWCGKIGDSGRGKLQDVSTRPRHYANRYGVWPLVRAWPIELRVIAKWSFALHPQTGDLEPMLQFLRDSGPQPGAIVPPWVLATLCLVQAARWPPAVRRISSSAIAQNPSGGKGLINAFVEGINACDGVLFPRMWEAFYMVVFVVVIVVLAVAVSRLLVGSVVVVVVVVGAVVVRVVSTVVLAQIVSTKVPHGLVPHGSVPRAALCRIRPRAVHGLPPRTASRRGRPDAVVVVIVVDVCCCFRPRRFPHCFCC